MNPTSQADMQQVTTGAAATAATAAPAAEVTAAVTGSGAADSTALVEGEEEGEEEGEGEGEGKGKGEGEGKGEQRPRRPIGPHRGLSDRYPHGRRKGEGRHGHPQPGRHAGRVGERVCHDDTVPVLQGDDAGGGALAVRKVRPRWYPQ